MRLAAILLGIGAIVIAALALGQKFLNTEEPIPVGSLIHYYKTPSVPLNLIHVEVFYVVPRGKAASLPKDWAKMLDESFRKAAHFHSVQFLGKSLMTYEIAPEPLALAGEAREAGSLFEENSEMLERIEEEVPPAYDGSGKYRVRIYIVESKGMGAKAGAAYVPAEIFGKDSWSSIKESVLYHALGRSFGLPRGHEGIMGIGMFRPIETTFIEPDLVQKMGLLN